MKASKIAQAVTSAGRALLLFAIFEVSIIALLAEPDDASQWWLEAFIISKAIAAIGFLAVWKLFSRWRKTDKWIKRFADKDDEETDAPNPLYIGREEEQQ